jgi:hypothetical protein
LIGEGESLALDADPWLPSRTRASRHCVYDRVPPPRAHGRNFSQLVQFAMTFNPVLSIRLGKFVASASPAAELVFVAGNFFDLARSLVADRVPIVAFVQSHRTTARTLPPGCSSSSGSNSRPGVWIAAAIQAANQLSQVFMSAPDLPDS